MVGEAEHQQCELPLAHPVTQEFDQREAYSGPARLVNGLGWAPGPGPGCCGDMGGCCSRTVDERLRSPIHARVIELLKARKDATPHVCV